VISNLIIVISDHAFCKKVRIKNMLNATEWLATLVPKNKNNKIQRLKKLKDNNGLCLHY